MKTFEGNYIKKITYIGETKPSKRQLKITLNNGTVVRAEKCYESWQQWGGTEKELYITMPIVEKHNEWFHGSQRPEESEVE
jgi:hypothetical protein